MQLKKIKTNAKNIKFTASYNADSDNVSAKEDRTITCSEMPTPEFGEALQRLTMVVIEVMGFKGEYVNGMTVDGLTMSHTANGTASMQISFTKVMDNLCGKVHKMSTPMFRIDEPADGENGALEVSKKSADFCARALTEAKSYAMGERSQMTFAQFAEENGALSKVESSELELVV